jgi:hypothetical protein
MSFELRIAIVVRRHLVLGVHLPRQADHLVLNPLILDRRAPIVVEGVRDDFVGGDPPPRAEEPEPVPHDRPPEREVEVGDVPDAVARLQPAVAQVLGDVVALPVAVGAADERRAAEAVAAFLRDHVDPHPAARDVCAGAARLEAHFRVCRVAEVGLHLAAVHQAVHRHAVHLHGRVGLPRPVRRHVDLLHLLVAADVRVALADAGHQCGEPRVVARRRHGVEQFPVQDGGPLRALHVDDRRVAGDGDGFLQGADAQVGVHRRREVGRQLELFVAQHVEAGEGERDGINAGPQIDDRVASLRVADRRAGPLDEHVARRFHSDARQHGAGGVPHEPGDRALREGRGGQQCQAGTECRGSKHTQREVHAGSFGNRCRA